MATVSRDASVPLRLLLLEDSSLDAELVAETLVATGLSYTLERVVAQHDFVHAIDGTRYDLILADFVLPGFDGMSALELARTRCPDTPFVFVSGTLGEEIAVEALKRGATDYVLKQRLDRLPGTVLRALAEARERNGRRRAQAALRELLEERTTLLNELDHRVKNNLQLLLSLVNQEIRRRGSPEAKAALHRIRLCLQALGAVHRELYRGDAVGAFDAGAFARELAADLLADASRASITPVIDAHLVRVPATKAAPVALLMNEIVANALDHAYHHRQGKLKLKVAPTDGGCLFEIMDDRFTDGEKQAAREGSTGSVLRALALQLQAEIDWPTDDPRVLVRVVIPDDLAHPSD